MPLYFQTDGRSCTYHACQRHFQHMPRIAGCDDQLVSKLIGTATTLRTTATVLMGVPTTTLDPTTATAC